MVDKYLAIYENLKAASCEEFCKDVVGEFLDQSVVDAMEEITCNQRPEKPAEEFSSPDHHV